MLLVILACFNASAPTTEEAFIGKSAVATRICRADVYTINNQFVFWQVLCIIAVLLFSPKLDTLRLRLPVPTIRHLAALELPNSKRGFVIMLLAFPAYDVLTNSLLNFFTSFCPPCAAYLPRFMFFCAIVIIHRWVSVRIVTIVRRGALPYVWYRSLLVGCFVLPASLVRFFRRRDKQLAVFACLPLAGNMKTSVRGAYLAATIGAALHP